MSKLNIISQINHIEKQLFDNNFINIHRYINLVNTRIRNLEAKLDHKRKTVAKRP